jgi:hypothetical protein
MVVSFSDFVFEQGTIANSQSSIANVDRETIIGCSQRCLQRARNGEEVMGEKHCPSVRGTVANWHSAIGHFPRCRLSH